MNIDPRIEQEFSKMMGQMQQEMSMPNASEQSHKLHAFDQGLKESLTEKKGALSSDEEEFLKSMKKDWLKHLK